MIDMITIANAHDSSYKINNKLVLLYYLDAALMTPSEWKVVFDNVRNIMKQDFYVVGATENPSFFAAFDALLPWVNLEQWRTAPGSSTYQKALNWVTKEHGALFSEVGKHPGRVVFGGVVPGFDDYTEDWGKCTPREIPRDLNLLQAEFDFLKSRKVKGVLLQTWDDWTEGTHFEPDVKEGPTLLVRMRQLLGSLYNEPPNPAGDKKLSDTWKHYGQVRNCKGGRHGTIPTINLKCP